MSWTSSIFVAALTGVLGLVVAGLVTYACTEWFNVSSREGASGYLVVAMALVGGAVAFVLGLVLSRVIGAQPDPGFFKTLGISCGAVVAIGGIALGMAWLKADFAPKIDGQYLELAIEVRAPKGFTLPQTVDEYGAHARVRIPGSGGYQQHGKLDLEHAKQEDGRWIVTAVVPLATSSSSKVMDVRFSKEHSLTFGLPLRSHPSRSDCEWSKWVDSGWEVGTVEPPPEKKFNLRYKVQLLVPPPPPRDPAAVEAEEFAALKPDAPLEQWLAYLTHDVPDDRGRAIMNVVEARLGELATLIRSTNDAVREPALAAVGRLTKINPEVTEAVLAEGRDIAAGIRHFNEMKPEDPGFHDLQVRLRSRFNHWKRAWWTLHQRLGLDGRPPVQEIHALALLRAHGTSMDEIEVNARVILDALKPAPEKKL